MVSQTGGWHLGQQQSYKTSSSPSRVEPRVDAPTRTLHISAPAPRRDAALARA